LELEKLLAERRDVDETTVLIVDEAQSLPLELLEEVRLLANIETETEKLLTVIMAGQPELADRLNDRVLRQLKQRVALRCELRPLTAQETAAYLAGRIKAAGGVGAHVFTREAVTRIHEFSGGIPRTISVIADNALLTGFALQHRPVTSQIVLDVCKDFDFETAEHSKAESEATSVHAASPAAPVPPPGRLLDLQPAGPQSADTGAPRESEPRDDNQVESAFPRLRRFFS
jgi:hypothetical protein